MQNRIFFQSFGVKIGIESAEDIDIRSVINKFRIALKYDFTEIAKDQVEFSYLIRRNPRDIFELVKNGKIFHRSGVEEMILDLLESQVRITIAEFAVEKVFMHAGVVGWKGNAIIFPGKSFFGKTTIVAELVKRGAEYLSDEYAVVDENGFVYPFPKMLSLRGIIDDFRQVDMAVEDLGGIASEKKLPVGMVLFTEYNSEAKWNPVKLSMGEGLMEMIPHTIPIRNNPKFSLNVLNKIVNRAIISKTQRGEAEIFAEIILDFFETQAV